MNPVIEEKKWVTWCEAHQINIAAAEFALETCYYGVNFRSRPGTLLLQKNQIVHYSYAPGDTSWAIFEKSIEVTMPISQIAKVQKKELSFFNKLVQDFPESYFQVEMKGGAVHHLILQRNGVHFVQALSSLGITVVQ
ncbi:MAG: hypothetical protein CVU44_08060 [Chloroflexi bacterium HGW-Chloroflexi-6]|nr:MAG: hypothetical protein CVU44_08060 [Chloroflexi bacterium HGW-Chloroflexi-6]